MTDDEELFSVSRIESGWLVRISERYARRTVHCATWDEVAKLCQEVAFPYPDKTEPRGPR